MIRSAREEAGLSRERLAQCAEVSVSTVVRLENHDQLPNAESLARIARILKVSLDDLLAGEVPA